MPHTYGDTEALRRRVSQLRDQATDLRALADQLVAATETTGWSGRAAESLHDRVTERHQALRVAAGHHDTAADALDKHVAEVDRQTEAIASVERRAERIINDARARVEAIERTNQEAREGGGAAAPAVEPDPDDVTLLQFTPPPSGHKDWLTIELRGL